MRKFNSIFLLFYLFPILLICSTSQAIVESSVHYGTVQIDPNLNDLYQRIKLLPDVKTTAGIGFDVVYIDIEKSFGLGFRYDNMGFTASNSDLDVKNQLAIVSILALCRFQLDNFFWGPVATYGINHSGYFKWIEKDSSSSEVISSEFSPSDAMSYSIGLELGTSSSGFLSGFEFGYSNIILKGLTESPIYLSSMPDLRLNGPYIKFFLGFRI